ncbi:SIS domain-containing protein [Arthrobacter gengyunqii]|uniref:SIS domain-containing protein n=1 Tax=Arthrobacter gengyunqii TaxID=2886940 RepID=A0A9X1M4S4_9MICC|nr:SIS domain-containing protein [Arthrobacter gengyunqii]MCC3270890.1 SIS domain-containing protein [Arthrobacter gengyunqii]UOY96420.1 SIS domain-containing protein [Arthrobacter gengyunqii]
MPSTFVEAEIASQPDTWRLAAQLVPDIASWLPCRGERVAVIGCGTSWFIAMSYAVLRESAGHGLTDAFAGSEYPSSRDYDRVIAISRSGTTTEIINLLRDLESTPTTLITAVADSPAAALASETIAMPFADEQSVVQTRFATSVLTVLRVHLGGDVQSLITEVQAALEIPVDDLLTADQCTFVGRGFAVGLSFEAALKTREAAQFWSESYPAMDYRHGPISIAEPGRLVWSLGEPPAGLAEEVSATGARFVHHDLDPQAALVVAQRFAVGLAKSRGLDPDHPRSLTRSVVLA